MSKVIYNFGGIDVVIQCSKDEKMKDICQRYANKIQNNLNSLIFLYGGKQLNFNLSFNKQANMIDKERNEMKVLVYKNEDNEYICPKCGEIIELNIKDDLISSVNKIKDVIIGIKLNIDNIIKTSLNNFVNIQLNNVNIIINSLNDDINKINEKINNLLNNNKRKNENIISNYIIAEIDIKEEDVNKYIAIINCYEEFMRSNSFTDIKNDCKNEDEIRKCEIKINDELIPFDYRYQFKSKGKYTINYSFHNNITNMSYMFCECSSITKIDLSNFNTDSVTNMNCMFRECASLEDINLSNFNTNIVTDMGYLFAGCSSLTKIDLSNFNTNNVTNMRYLFFRCSSLIEINLSNFNTNKVTDFMRIFDGCKKLRKESIITSDEKLLNIKFK